jgi:hypothetical protein
VLIGPFYSPIVLVHTAYIAFGSTVASNVLVRSYQHCIGHVCSFAYKKNDCFHVHDLPCINDPRICKSWILENFCQESLTFQSLSEAMILFVHLFEKHNFICAGTEM